VLIWVLLASGLGNFPGDFLSKIRHLFIIIRVTNYKIYVKIRFKIDTRGGSVA